MGREVCEALLMITFLPPKFCEDFGGGGEINRDTKALGGIKDMKCVCVCV